MLPKKPEEFHSWQGEVYLLQPSLRISGVHILFLNTPKDSCNSPTLENTCWSGFQLQIASCAIGNLSKDEKD